MRTLIIVGHSNPKSLSHYFADSLLESPKLQNKDNIRVLDLAKLEFDPILKFSSPVMQSLEPDLVKAQEDILWSEHIILLFPIWWSSCPAILKGFFDRVLTPNFAFKYDETKLFPLKLLKGRSALLIVTSDSPAFYRKYVLNDPAVRAIKRDTLGFCGIKVESVSYFGPVRSASPSHINKWKAQIVKLLS